MFRKNSARVRFIRLFAVTLAMLGLLAIVPSVASAAFPDKQINYIISFNPGGESDVTARFQQSLLEEALGTKIVITYKIGADGAAGWSELVRAKPDGYTIAGHNIPHIILQPMLRGNAGYETADLKSIYLFESTPNILVVRKDSQFKTLKDLIEYAKAHPGAVTVGGSGSDTANHLGVLELNQEANIKLTYIPFTGSGAAVPALLGGNVTALMTYSTSYILQKDQFRALAIASPKRFRVISDVPTFRELGYDLVEGAYRGVAAPPGTPDSVMKILEKAFDKVTRNPELIDKMEKLGFVIETMGMEESTKFIQNRTTYYRKLLIEVGRLK